MVRGVENIKKLDKQKDSLVQKKDYITEAMLQGGKAIGELVKPKKKKKKR